MTTQTTTSDIGRQASRHQRGNQKPSTDEGLTMTKR